MPRRRYFSEESELRRPPEGLIREHIPDGLRNAVRGWIDGSKALDSSSHRELWQFIVDEFDLGPERQYVSGVDQLRGDSYYLRIANRFKYSRWSEFLDTCSALYYWLESKGDGPADEFANLLNARFLRYYLGYEMGSDGLIAEVGSKESVRAVAEARALLRDPRMNGPNRDFQAALNAYHQRPEPAYEQAVPKALNAVEGVVQIVLERKKRGQFGNEMKAIVRQHGLHPALGESVEKLWGYASDAGGRHALIGDPKVDRTIAEFCLHQAAAAIVLIAHLYGVEVVEGSEQ